MNTNELLKNANITTYIVLKNRAQKSGLQFLHNLNAMAHNDQLASECAEYFASVAPRKRELLAQREELNKARAFHHAQWQRATLPLDEKRVHKSEEARIIRELAKIRNELKNIEQGEDKHLQATFSDRQDLVHDCVVALLELERLTSAELCERATISMIASYGADTLEELDEVELADLIARIKWRGGCSAVNKGIGKLASPDALNSHVTQPRKASADEVSEWFENYGDDWERAKRAVNVRRARVSDCFETLRKNDKKNCFEIVRHYKTIAPYTYLNEVLTADEDGNECLIEQTTKVYNPLIEKPADLDFIEDLAMRANLSRRDSLFLEYLARAFRFSHDLKDCKESAYKRIGALSPSAQRKHFSRLCKKLREAK